MQKDTARFGALNYTEEDVITFPSGLIGFNFLTNFVLVQHKVDSPFQWLQSLDDGETAFLVTDPCAYVLDYSPIISDEDAGDLQIADDTPAVVLTTVCIPPSRPQDMTLNLAAPLVVNAISKVAKQVVLEDHAYTIKHRVFPMADEEGQAIAA